MKNLKLAGEDWRITNDRRSFTPEEKLQRQVSQMAIEIAGVIGPDVVINAFLAAAINTAAKCGVVEGDLQKALHELACQSPDMIATIRLANSNKGKSRETTS